MGSSFLEPEHNYITKYLTPIVEYLGNCTTHLKSGTSKGPFLPRNKSTLLTKISEMNSDNLKSETSKSLNFHRKNSEASLTNLKRESYEQALKQIEIKRSKSVNDLDED